MRGEGVFLVATLSCRPNKDRNAGKPTPWDESPEIEMNKYLPFEDQTSYKAAYQVRGVRRSEEGRRGSGGGEGGTRWREAPPSPPQRVKPPQDTWNSRQNPKVQV
eukprot:768412-Hanusia_phi.AAC.2